MQTADQIKAAIDRFVDEPSGEYVNPESWDGYPLNDWEDFQEMDPSDFMVVPGVEGEIRFVGLQEQGGNRHVMVLDVGGRKFGYFGQWVSHEGMHWDHDLAEVEERAVTQKVWSRI